MKKIVFIVLAIITLVSCTQQKIGFVNTETLIKDYKETQIVEATMKAKSEKSQKNLETLFSAFQAKVLAYQKGAARMSATKRVQKEQELGAEQQALQQKQQQIQYQVQTEGQAAIKKIAETVNDFIKDYGKKNGYSLVLGTVDLNGAVMYGDAKADLTQIVLTALNENHNKENKTEEAPVTETKKDTSKEEVPKK